MSHDKGAGIVHGGIAVGVVEVPVCVDEQLERMRPDLVERLAQMRRGRGHAGIDKQLSIRSDLYHHVAAHALEKKDGVAQLSGLDRGNAARLAQVLDEPRWRRRRNRPGWELRGLLS